MSRVQEAVSALKLMTPNLSRFAVAKKTAMGKTIFPHISQPITDELLTAHVMGKKLIGAVGGDEHLLTKCVGLDLDAHVRGQNPHKAAHVFIQSCQALEVPAVVHQSKGGKGLHVRTFFDKPVPSYVARALYMMMVKTSRLFENDAFDKVWPPPNGHGVLALPYNLSWMKSTGGGRALDPNTLEPLPNGMQLECVLDCEAIEDENEVRSRLRSFGMGDVELALMGGLVDDTPNQPGGRNQGGYASDGQDQGLADMMRSCVAVQDFVRQPGQVSYEFWFSMMTNFKRFEGGRDMFDRISACDPERFDQRRLQTHWVSIKGGPRRCESLDPGNFQCPARAVCPARAPAGLPGTLRRQHRK